MKARNIPNFGVLAALLFALLSAGCGNVPPSPSTRSLVPAEAGCC